MDRRSFAHEILGTVLLCLLGLSIRAEADTVSTSFESVPSGDFTIGTSPVTATFTNGNAQTVGNLALYVTGTHSWHISPGTTASVAFETPASEVTFFFRDTPDAGPSEARVLDVDGMVLSATTGTQSFQQITVTRAAGEPLIASVEVENSGGSGDVVVDDVSFTAEEPTVGGPLEDPIPEPIPLGAETELATIATGLTAPNWATQAPGDATRLFIVDQTGILHVLDLSTMQLSTFLDLSSRLVELGAFGPGTFDERGFLGLAFHPDYASNGLLYTYTSEPAAGTPDFSTMPAGTDPNHHSVITEWQVPTPADPAAVVDVASARELVRIAEPQFNHNAGALEFDLDGYLLIALGDGGGADDTAVGHGAEGNGNDPSNPLGSLLRIDVNGNNSANGQYGIPSTNPFIGQAGFTDEIFAYGFRNPFRIALDDMTGDLWVADVGQNDIEEINLVTIGNNYGWNHKEGSFFFDPNGADPGFVTDVDPGVPADLVDPVAEYDHDEGIAIVGGFVYRAGLIPELENRYVFGDFGSDNAGRLFYLADGNEVTELGVRGQPDLGLSLLGFGRDMAGNVYVLANSTGTPFEDTGVVMRIDPGPGAVLFDPVTATVDEGAGMLSVSVVRRGGSGGMASVDYVTAADTAIEGTDYTATSGTLQWADGEDGVKTFDVAIAEDTIEEAGETFTVMLSNAVGAELGAEATLTVTIADNDAPAPPPPPPPPPVPTGGGGGAVEWPALSLLLLIGLMRIRRRAARAPKTMPLH